MKRVITIVQRKGMQGVLSHAGRANRSKPDCAHCRHSQSTIIDGAWKFVCAVLHAVVDGDRASTCDRFRDSRAPLHHSYLRVQ